MSDIAKTSDPSKGGCVCAAMDTLKKWLNIL